MHCTLACALCVCILIPRVFHLFTKMKDHENKVCVFILCIVHCARNLCIVALTVHWTSGLCSSSKIVYS